MTIFVNKMEVVQRFGFVADARAIPEWRRKGWPLPTAFRAAVRTVSGEVIAAKAGEHYHSHIINRVSEAIEEEGYVYESNA